MENRGKQFRQRDRLLALYIRDVMAEEVLDKPTEIRIAKELRYKEIERWVELLHDPSSHEIVDAAIIETSKKLYTEEAAAAIQPALQRLRKAAYLEDEDSVLGRDYEQAMELILAVIVSLDKKRKLFNAVYDSLSAKSHLEELLHPDTIWYIDALECCVEQLKHRFIRANLQNVVKIAKKYDFGTLPLADLIQEGNIGLMNAVDRFDHTRGYRFMTFAFHWIRHAMRKTIAHRGQTVRIPARVIDDQYRIQSAIDRFELSNGRCPTDHELAGILDMPLERLMRMKEQPVIRVHSMDRPMPGHRTDRYIDMLVDENSTCPHDSIMLKTWIRKKESFLNALTTIERAIVCWRFGLDGDNEMSLRQIGERCDLSKERIRQIQNVALQKLRLAFDG